jgi:hypothetical protein
VFRLGEKHARIGTGEFAIDALGSGDLGDILLTLNGEPP